MNENLSNNDSSGESAADMFAPFDNPQLTSAWLGAIIESADDAIISKTLDGIITSWNHGAERIFGYSSEEAVGQPVEMLMPRDQKSEEPQILARLRRGERIQHYETLRVRKDGGLIHISLTVSPIFDANGNIVGASKIARDISDRKMVEARLQQALQEAHDARLQAEAANRVKDEFLNTLSHELRTPLTAMVGWITMLRGGHLDNDSAREALVSIERNAKIQAQLIEDLLDISHILNGKMRLEVKLLDITPIIHAAVESIMPAARAKNLRFQTVLNAGPGPVLADPDRLQQALWNLLSNAVKFTPADGQVCVELESVPPNIVIKVCDSGIGIDPEFLPHIFDRFLQEDGSSTRNYGGLGLGLSIVKSIIELHGGTIKAVSDGPDKGSTFCVALPVAQEHADLLMARRATDIASGQKILTPPPELRGLRLLVVDDEPDIVEMVRNAFEQCGTEVRIATSAAGALLQLEEWKPDILLADLNMPRTNGYQLIERVRERDAQHGGRTPAVALTAMSRAEDRVKALTAGYQMYVTKPIELMELYTV
ncbi:MAG TPA: PAS domain S-box protein, partial [Abditibacteriaceae bacterium]